MKLEQIIFKTNLNNEVCMSLENEKLNAFYDIDLMDEIAASTYKVNIYSFGEDEEKEIKLGYIDGTFINVVALHESGYNSYDVLDEVGGVEVDSYSYFYDNDNNPKYDEKTGFELVGSSDNIFHLDTLYINKKYRNQGLGSKIMKSLNDIILCVLHLQVGAITFRVEPFEKNIENTPENMNLKDIKRLEKFYENCGYKKIPGVTMIKGKFSQFYKNTDLI